MEWIAAALCLVVVVISVLGFVSPSAFVSAARRLHNRGAIIGMGLFRIALGVSLFMRPADTPKPLLLRLLGAVIVVIGLISLFTSVERFSKAIDWWASRNPIFQRLWCAVGLFGGLWLIYLLLGNKLIGGE